MNKTKALQHRRCWLHTPGDRELVPSGGRLAIGEPQLSEGCPGMEPSPFSPFSHFFDLPAE